MKLRPYQKRDVQSILQMVSKNQHSAYVLPTGGGKTLVVGYVILSLIKEYKRIMFSVPRVSLITQTIKVFKGLGINCGEKHDNNQVIVICNYSVKRYINKIKPDFIIFDEAHIAIHMQEEIMKKRNCKVLGITATPECLRSREKILKFSDVYSKKHFGPNINELTKTGHLVPVQAKYYNFDDDEISLNASGDFNGKEAFDSIQKQGTVVKVAKEINKHPEQKHILIFTISLAAVKEITKYLNKKCGGGFVGVTSKDYEYGRGKKKLGRYKLHEQIYDDFEAGKIRGIVNCNLINFGWDKPCVDTIYQLRPTMSKALYLQMIGRGLRPDTNKKFVRLYDMVGNIKRFNENGVPLYEVGDIKWENDKINKRRFPIGPKTVFICEFNNHICINTDKCFLGGYKKALKKFNDKIPKICKWSIIKSIEASEAAAIKRDKIKKLQDRNVAWKEVAKITGIPFAACVNTRNSMQVHWERHNLDKFSWDMDTQLFIDYCDKFPWNPDLKRNALQKKVISIKSGKVYDTIDECAKAEGVNYTSVYKHCYNINGNGGRYAKKFMFLDDYKNNKPEPAYGVLSVVTGKTYKNCSECARVEKVSVQSVYNQYSGKTHKKNSQYIKVEL